LRNVSYLWSIATLIYNRRMFLLLPNDAAPASSAWFWRAFSSRQDLPLREHVVSSTVTLKRAGTHGAATNKNSSLNKVMFW
jgi:hypothetical protein